MIEYTILQQIAIFFNCNNAVELLEAKEFIQEQQTLNKVPSCVFDFRMKFFLENNLITSIN